MKILVQRDFERDRILLLETEDSGKALPVAASENRLQIALFMIKIINHEAPKIGNQHNLPELSWTLGRQKFVDWQKLYLFNSTVLIKSIWKDTRGKRNVP